MSNAAVNLLWQARVRGVLAAECHNLADDGSAVLLRPDEFETRTYQVLAVDHDGMASEQYAITVETVQKLIALPGGRLLVGMTNDDIYLFRDGKKVRFLADRRVAYADIDLATEVGWFVAGFSDSLYASHAIVLADASGRLAWSKDLQRAPTRVTITHDGRSLFVGLDTGRLLAFDNTRQLQWEHGLPGPATALTAPHSGARVFAGNVDGAVIAIGTDGLALWRAELSLPVRALATDAAGKWVAALLTDGSSHGLTVLGAEGEVVWEHTLEAKPTGVSLSPNGRYILVTSAPGYASQFEADFSRAAAAAPVSRRDRDLATAREAFERGDLLDAHARLRELAAQTPHDLEVAEAWLTARNTLLASERETATELTAAGRYGEALARLEAAGGLDPWSEELFRQRQEVRQVALQSAAACASMCEANADWDGAATAWREALALDPAALDARRELLRVLGLHAAALTRAGDEKSTAGDTLVAVDLWRRAQSLAPTPELEDRLQRAEVERCVRTGIAYYEEHRLPEAVFQLRKALALDPYHEQAARYLGYAQGQTSNTQVANRFAHLE